jgi:anti-sigma regulatory factor (Ser/Thr protein kinase)
MPTAPRQLTFPSRLENLPPIIDFVTAFMEENGVDPGTISRVQVAADEAATNVIKHAYGGKVGPITILCAIEEGVLTVTFLDQGVPFDPTTVKEPDLESGVEDRPIGGLGIYFMRQLMDEVLYHRPADGGNALTLRKKLVAKT